MGEAAGEDAGMAADGAPPAPWLSIVGIGEDGVAGLSPTACTAVTDARLVFGGARHLALAGALVRGEARPWPSPFSDGVAQVCAARGTTVCVLASGDPFLFGVGATLARFVSAAEMRVYPAPSAFSLAAARLGWPLQEVACLSLHGREIARVRPALHPGARILALTSDGAAPGEIAALLTRLGFGASQLWVLEALGGPRERVRSVRAETFALTDVDPLNLLAITVAGEAAPVLHLGGGLPDDLFEHDGQITKREIRALTLSALAPRRGECLWDIGAGAGSVAIEWLLADASLAAIAIEAVPERAARIGRNAAALGVPHLRIVSGAAPAALVGLPPPDAVFVGGGGGEEGVLEAAIFDLKPGGRLVANAVTLETEARLLDLHAKHGGDLLRVALGRAVPVKGMTGWRPAMPITQWVWHKPREAGR
ncbi:precorrin-6y C5,15-methyltransferase (decarboxylating) subunit CbiE [Aquabacter spiritensis]|uniref:Precorrin-6Y C5,15-methyltransferase (Decarboxylating) n=1 Tax=Aquabacter spiritensis TaxID=933073 RepID=A0A4R3M698_9HYPH|nr:precorrin-6y C5,15-methyltransferase (decarboxylating) subunit CbiE [Aquabacter spiritensis]TCT08123.1 precorrin-6Y C5,15-methyltransferase (decarboxylating) [Aquabacter spiritensis]